MKSPSFFILIVFLLVIRTNAQVKFEPSMVVLFPNEVVMSAAIKKELHDYVQEVEITDEIRKNFIKEGLAANWKMIREKELDFIKKQDFPTLLTLAITREFTYREVQHHDNLLIYPVKETCGTDRAIYKLLTDKYNVTWLLNITKVELFYSEQKKKSMKVSLQLFNTHATWLFIDTTYAADDSITPQSCEPGTWLCLVENVKSRIAKEVTDKVERNRHLRHNH